MKIIHKTLEEKYNAVVSKKSKYLVNVVVEEYLPNAVYTEIGIDLDKLQSVLKQQSLSQEDFFAIRAKKQQEAEKEMIERLRKENQ